MGLKVSVWFGERGKDGIGSWYYRSGLLIRE